MSNEHKAKAPIPVKLACLVWVLYGLMLLGGGLLMGVLGAGKEKAFELMLALGLGGCGVFFMHAGIKTFSARASGTVGNGICAMFFGAALIASNLDSGINLFAGFGLLLSGLVCVAYRKQYQSATAQ